MCDWLGGPHLWSGHASNNENKNAFSIDFGITDSGFKNRVAATQQTTITVIRYTFELKFWKIGIQSLSPADPLENMIEEHYFDLVIYLLIPIMRNHNYVYLSTW